MPEHRDNSEEPGSVLAGSQAARQHLSKLIAKKKPQAGTGGRGHLRDRKFFKHRDGELMRRVARRKRDELMFDILLSGTSATLLIMTARKIYIGWVGDSLVAMQGSEKNIQ